MVFRWKVNMVGELCDGVNQRTLEAGVQRALDAWQDSLASLLPRRDSLLRGQPTDAEMRMIRTVIVTLGTPERFSTLAAESKIAVDDLDSPALFLPRDSTSGSVSYVGGVVFLNQAPVARLRPGGTVSACYRVRHQDASACGLACAHPYCLQLLLLHECGHALGLCHLPPEAGTTMSSCGQLGMDHLDREHPTPAERQLLAKLLQ